MGLRILIASIVMLAATLFMSVLPLPSMTTPAAPDQPAQQTLPPLYKSGSTVFLEPYLPQEKPKIFRFEGRVILDNRRPCSTPIIEYAGEKDHDVILPENKWVTILQAHPGKTVEVMVWLKNASPCPKP